MSIKVCIILFVVFKFFIVIVLFLLEKNGFNIFWILNSFFNEVNLKRLGKL